MGINSRQLIDALPIVDENILAEAAKQPTLFVQAARYRVAKMRKRSQADATLDYRLARLALGIRRTQAEVGEKLTEVALKERITASKLARQLRSDLAQAEEEEEFAKLLVEAFRMRRDAIRVIAETQIAEGMRGGAEVERIEQRRRIRNQAVALEEKRQRARVTDED